VLESSPFVVDFLSHLLIGFELLFPVLIWSRLLRPLVLGVAVVVWTLLALVTGDLTFTFALFTASLAFIQPETLLGAIRPRQAIAAAG
jgi:hypothetical protein